MSKPDTAAGEMGKKCSPFLTRRRIREAYSRDRERWVNVWESAQLLLEALETCHICKGSLIPSETPSYCENCSWDCDDHDEPVCVPINVLHENLRRALSQLPAPPEEEAQ